MLPTTAMKPRLDLEQLGEASAMLFQFWFLSYCRCCWAFLPFILGVESGVGRPDSSPSAWNGGKHEHLRGLLKYQILIFDQINADDGVLRVWIPVADPARRPPAPDPGVR